MENSNQLGSTGVYAPCPCGSGKKVKFCCGAVKSVEPEKPSENPRKMEEDRSPTPAASKRLGPADAVISHRYGRRKV